jgi:hypothetical protein
VALVLALALLAGCGNEREILSLWMDPTGLTPPRDARELRSSGTAVRGMAAIMGTKLGLPVPEWLMVYVYSGREAFERGLIEDALLAPERAAELSGFAVGISQRRQILLRDGGPLQSQREWLRLIAHELAHVSQIEMAGGEGRAEQWLAEGLAEWAAYTALEHLGLDSLERHRATATAGLSNHLTLVLARLDLESRGTPRGFTTWHLSEGSLPTYQLAFLMADYLIDRHGLPRVLAYFRSFARSRDRHRNFRGAFGRTLAEFETDVLAHLKAQVNPR